MIKRPRQIDHFRTITRINVWEEFNSFDNDGQQGNNAAQSGNTNQSATLNGEKDNALKQKQEIPIIAASNIKIQNTVSANNITDDLYKKRRIHQSNYIRIRQDQIWPLPEKYELADDDLLYLKDFNESNNFNMKEEELESIIESLEFKSGKDFIITWIDMKDYITNDLRDKYTFTNLEKIYNYWRIKRDLLKRPLLRLHWKPNFNDKDPHVAFRPRVAEKMKLRRPIKQNDGEQLFKLSQLKEEMIKYKLLVQQIKLREQMKEWILESQNISFVSELYKVDKSMQYFFVDDVFENNKDLELKKQQMDEKVGSIREQNNQLNKSLSAYNLFPVKQPKDSISQHNKFLRATPNPSNFLKDQKTNPEIIKASDAQNSSTNIVNPLSSTTISLVNGGLSKKEMKKNAQQISIPLSEEIPPLSDVDTKKKIKDKIKGKKDDISSLEVDQHSGKLINISLNKDKIIKKNSGVNIQPPIKDSSITSISNLKNLDLKKDESSSKQSKQTKKDTKEEGILKNISENLSSQVASGEKDSLKIQDKLNQVSNTESKDLPVSSLSGLSLFNTDNFEFASFIASVFIEASKHELTVERVCNPDTKSIDRDHLQLIISSKSELAQQLKKISKSNNQPSGSFTNKNQNINNDPHNNYSMNTNYSHQNPNQAMNGHHHDIVQNQRLYQQQRSIEQGSQYGSGVSNQNQNEIPHAKKKNVIPFKPRLRTGRSGFVIIDRLFDDKDNLRYEDICSKEANYHPNKIVDKILAQQRMKERAEQQKLKVFSFKTSDRELFNKDYFQQRNMKYKYLAEDNEETHFLYPPSNTSNLQASSSVNPAPSQPGSNQGYTSAQLNGGNQEGVSMEDSISGLMLSSSVNSQQMFNNEQDFKQLKKTINTALKNYQKTKQQSFFK